MRKKALEKNLRSIKKVINQASIDNGHKVPELVAVSKYSPLEDILLCYELGQRDFAEAKVQDLLLKARECQSLNLHEIKWHFIGPIQSNKIKKLSQVPNLSMVHSLGKLSHLQEFHQCKFSAPIRYLLQINMAKESNKQGFLAKENLNEALDLIIKYEKLNLGENIFAGLMCMGENFQDKLELKKEAYRTFVKLASLRDQIKQEYTYFNKHDLKLSMGMTADYDEALKVGPDFLRLGSAIFQNLKPIL